MLSNNEAFLEVNQVYYSLGHTKYVGDPWQSMLVKRELNAVLENIVAGLNEELQVAFDAHFGTDKNSWKRINLLETVRLVVAQAASRFTVGLPLCTFALGSFLFGYWVATDSRSQAETGSISRPLWML